MVEQVMITRVRPWASTSFVGCIVEVIGFRSDATTDLEVDGMLVADLAPAGENGTTFLLIEVGDRLTVDAGGRLLRAITAQKVRGS